MAYFFMFSGDVSRWARLWKCV